MKKLKVGVVGVGYLGKFHAEKYAHMDDVALVGVVDIEKSKVKMRQKDSPQHPITGMRILQVK